MQSYTTTESCTKPSLNCNILPDSQESRVDLLSTIQSVSPLQEFT